MTKKYGTLWAEYKISKDPTDLIEFYTPFAQSIAKSKHRNLPSFVNLEDIEASAMVGLWMAIERFDDSIGVPFESFARQRILGSILDDIREEDHSSRSTRDLQKEIERTVNELSNVLNRAPEDEEIADKLGLSINEVRAYQQRILETSLISLDTLVRVDINDGTLTDLIASKTNHDSIDKQSTLNKILKVFTKRERLLFALMYFEGYTLEQCAPIIGLTHPMTCQMHFRLIDRLEERRQAALRKDR